MRIAYVECPKCGHNSRVSVSTDGRGGMVETLLAACEHERKARGICARCPKPLASTKSGAKFCTEHAKEARRQASRRYRERKGEEYRTRSAEMQRKRYHKNPDAFRQRKRKHYEAHREEYLEKQREGNRFGDPRRSRRNESARQNYERNKEARQAKAREYYQQNRERILAERRAAKDVRRRRAAVKRALDQRRAA